jgi:hypothetical protein
MIPIINFFQNIQEKEEEKSLLNLALLIFRPNETSMREIEDYPVEQFQMKERV